MFSHKMETIQKFLIGVLGAATANWRAVIAYSLTLLFIYFLLRLMEGALFRVLLSVCLFAMVLFVLWHGMLRFVAATNRCRHGFAK